MNVKSLVLIAILVFSIQLSFATFTSHPVVDQTSGEISGLTYSHGWVNFTDSGNFTVSDSGFVDEMASKSEVYNDTINLITSFEVTDFIYRLDEAYFAENYNGTRKFWLDNTTLWMWLDQLIARNNIDPTMKLNVTEDVGVNMATVVSDAGDFLGQYPVNQTFLEFFDKDANNNVVYRMFLISINIVTVHVNTVAYDVTVNATRAAYSAFAYYGEYSMSYDVTGYAYEVTVTDGDNFGYRALMFDNVTAQYTEVTTFFMSYYFLAFQFYELTFANGTDVPFEMYPRNMMPIVAESQGTMIDATVNYANLTAITTFQSVIAAFMSRSTNDTIDAAKLTIFASQKTTMLLAYQDGNDNNMLDMGLDQDGFHPIMNDVVTHIGFGEAYNLDLISLQYQSHVYNNSLYLPGYNINMTETNVNETSFIVNTANVHFGNVNVHRTTTPIWAEPEVMSDGRVHFHYGMDYSDFPVTWVSTLNGEVTVDQEHIKYEYDLYVDPETGVAQHSPTFTFGGVNDATLKSDLATSSLAFPVLLQYFTLEAVHAKTQTNSTVNTTQSTAGAYFAVENGLGDNFIEVNLPEDKQTYSIGSDTYNASLSALNLITVVGGAFNETTTPITTETQQTTGTATMNAEKELYAFQFVYSETLYIVSYPVWGGNEIVHDPDYNVYYEPKQITTTSSSTTSSTSSSTTSTNTNTETTTTTYPTTQTDTSTTEESSSNQSQTPGFTLNFALIPLTLGAVFLYKKRKN